MNLVWDIRGLTACGTAILYQPRERFRGNLWLEKFIWESLGNWQWLKLVI